jgi:hypothetical protein
MGVNLMNSPELQEPQPVMNEAPKPKRMGWLFLYFGIAFIIAIWTALGALFFLAVVWVLSRNPGPDVSFIIGRNDKKTAQRIYTWLFLSSFLTVPIFLMSAAGTYSSSSTNNTYVLMALVPLVLHLPLLTGLTSKSGFVYRHTQQAILLIALRAGMASLAAINVEDHIDYALLLFVFGNGLLWLVGSIVGWSQVSSGKCWFMERKGEKLLTPESTQAQKTIAPLEDKELEDMLKSLDAPGMTTARQKAMHAFRTGTPETKKRAIAVLSQLGEVEKF